MASSQTTTPTPPAVDSELEAAKARIAELEAKAADADANATRVAELEQQIADIAVATPSGDAPVVYANEPASTIGEGYPIGVYIGPDATETQIDGVAYHVDPESGCITKQKRGK